MTHENLPNQAMLDGISAGWPAVLANLKSLLETGDVLPQAPWEMSPARTEPRSPLKRDTPWTPPRSATPTARCWTPPPPSADAGDRSARRREWNADQILAHVSLVNAATIATAARVAAGSEHHLRQPHRARHLDLDRVIALAGGNAGLRERIRLPGRGPLRARRVRR